MTVIILTDSSRIMKDTFEYSSSLEELVFVDIMLSSAIIHYYPHLLLYIHSLLTLDKLCCNAEDRIEFRRVVISTAPARLTYWSIVHRCQYVLTMFASHTRKKRRLAKIAKI